jgi:dienelactone hydrolase
MSKVTIREKIVFKKVNDTSLTMDIYYPPGFNKKRNLPLVVFNNGAGVMEMPQWRVYRDWAKLIAAHGMIALNYQVRRGNSLIDGEALMDYLVQHGREYNIDPEKIGMWTCSANARTGLWLAHKSRPENIKAVVVYYGGPDSLGRLRQDLPTLVVRAGLDAQYLNMRIENFVDQSFKQDTRLEVINYVNGIHAFDIYNNTEETKEIIKRTIAFLKTNLENPVPVQSSWTLTNRNFMWMIMNGELEQAIAEFRKARDKYRADSTFQPFYNGVIREDILNTNAYWLLRNQHQLQALEVFKLMVETYPESPNAYDGLADAYETLGEKAAAIINAEKALQKLAAASNLSTQLKESIRKSARDKMSRLKIEPQ